MKNRDGEIILMVIDKKVWQISRKMAMATVNLAKEKYSKMNVNAILAVEKGNTITLQKDVYQDTDAFIKAIAGWEHGGYTCYYTTKKEEGKVKC